CLVRGGFGEAHGRRASRDWRFLSRARNRKKPSWRRWKNPYSRFMPRRNPNLPPGPSLPAAVQTAHWVTRPLPFLDRARKQYGDIFTIRLLGMGPMVMVAAPDAIKTIFTGSSDVLLAGEGNAPLSAFVGDNSLLILDRQPHLR